MAVYYKSNEPLDRDDVARLARTQASDINRDNTGIEHIRAEAIEYYNRRRPYPNKVEDPITGEKQINGSEYVSSDVYDGVESVKAAVTEAFWTNEQDPIILHPTGDPDVEQAQDFIKTVLNLEMLQECAHNGALLKCGPVMVRWEPKEIDLDQLPEEVQIALAEGLIPIPGEIKVHTINPEDFFIRGTDLHDDWYSIGHYEQVSRGDLYAQGIDPEIVDRLPEIAWDGGDQAVKHARRNQDDERDPALPGHRTFVEHSQKLVRICHQFLRLDVDRDGQMEVVYVMYGEHSTEWMHVELVDDHWYEAFHAYPIPGKFYGQSEYELLRQVQDSRTFLHREILNNIYAANRDRTEIDETKIDLARKDEYLQASERIGGTYFTRGSGAIQHVPRIPLPQETLPMDELLQREKEQLTGQSRISQGTQAEVVSKQNAADLIEAYVNLGQKRIAMLIRFNANKFLIPLVKRIHRMAIRHGQQLDGTSIVVNGRETQIMPSMWRPQLDVQVQTALTSDEQQEQARRILAWDQKLSQDEQMRPLYGLQQRYAALSQAMVLMGLPAHQLLIDPGSPEFAQMMEQQAQQAQQAQMLQMQQMAAQMQLVEAQTRKLRTESAVTVAKQLNDADIDDRTADLKESQFDWQKLMDLREAEIEEDQQRAVNLGRRVQ